jgi:hypothetical protein
VLLSQAAYQGGGLAAPLATLTVVNPVVAAAIGITMFDETFRYGTTGTALALASGVVAAGGLILLTTERIERTPVVEAGGFPAVDGAELAAGKAEDLPVAAAVTGPRRTEGTPSAAPAGVVPFVATLTVLDPGLLVPRQQPVPLPPYAAPGPYDAYASPGPYDAPERAGAAGEGEDADAVGAVGALGAVGAVGALGAVGAVGSVAGHFAVLNVGPCYGGAFVPAVVLDRHRPRVKS